LHSGNGYDFHEWPAAIRTIAMARNVEAVWNEDHQTLRMQSRTHAVTNFNWERTFSTLVGEVYGAALANAANRARLARTWFDFRSPRFQRKAG